MFLRIWQETRIYLTNYMQQSHLLSDVRSVGPIIWSITKSQERKEHRTHNQTKEGYCIGHILHRNCVTEGQIEGTRRLCRRNKHLLDDLKKWRKKCWNLEEVALDRILWRTRFVTGYGPVVRRTAQCKWIRSAGQEIHRVLGNTKNQELTTICI